MLRLAATCALLPILAPAAIPRGPAQDPAASLELRVERTIARALPWLASKQGKDGLWPGHETAHAGGLTALACYALVKSGVPATDPALVGGLRALSGIEFASTYSASVHLLLAAALHEARDRSRTLPAPIAEASARRSFDFLLASQDRGLWAYPSGAADMSNTQFALLGLRAGSQLGFPVPEKALERSATALFRLQTDAGGFTYAGSGAGDVSRGGMTAATLAGIRVLEDLGRGSLVVESALGKRRDRVRAAETWMEARFDAARPPFGERSWTSSWEYSYLWAIERWCGLTGRKAIGKKDWYQDGAERLLALQGPDGDFGNSVDDTCFALLFLRRATLTGWEDRSEVFRRIDAEQRASAAPRVAPAADAPRIVDWLVAGPYRDEAECARFEKADLARLRPRERAKHEGEVFERLSLSASDWTDLEVLARRPGDRVYWILATNLVWSGDAPLDATLWFAFEDPWKVWLDGQLVSFEMRTASPIREDVVVPVTIAPGAHALVVLAADAGGASAFSGRITDRAGKSLPAGFSISAEPPRKR
jgi:hypothetical protein